MEGTEPKTKKQEAMKISVITVAYNADATIARTIDSFLAQDHADREMIVIDGASTDSTCEIVRQYNSPLIRLISEPDKGIYDGMNKGLALIQGDAFGCLNADDCYHSPSSLSKIADALKTADIVSGRLHFVRAHDGSAPARVWQPTAFQKGAYRWGFTLPHPSTYARHSAIERVGQFSIDYRTAGDYDWLMRALETHGLSHVVIQDVLVDMLIGGQSTGGIKAVINNSHEMLAIRQRRLGAGAVDLALFFNLFRKMGQILGARLSVSKKDNLG